VIAENGIGVQLGLVLSWNADEQAPGYAVRIFTIRPELVLVTRFEICTVSGGTIAVR